jgi:Kef-type K+ transport system membrane component KefB
MDVVVSHLLLPVFFVVTGLSTHVDQLAWIDLFAVAAVIAVATLGKLGGSALADRLTGERWREAFTLGVLMNTRGLTEIVVLSVGLQLGIITTTTLFTIMVVMAPVTTAMAPPLLRRLGRPDQRTEPIAAVSVVE